MHVVCLRGSSVGKIRPAAHSKGSASEKRCWMCIAVFFPKLLVPQIIFSPKASVFQLVSTLCALECRFKRAQVQVFKKRKKHKLLPEVNFEAMFGRFFVAFREQKLSEL